VKKLASVIGPRQPRGRAQIDERPLRGGFFFFLFFFFLAKSAETLLSVGAPVF